MRAAKILILFYLFPLLAAGQEQRAILMQDTSINTLKNINSGYVFKPPSLSLPLSLRIIPENTSYYYNQLSIISSPYSTWRLQKNIDFVSIWKLEMAKQEKYKTLYTILGSIEAGGAAYLTYLHFKKYGLR